MSEKQDAIVIEKLCKDYGTNRVLKEISFMESIT